MTRVLFIETLGDGGIAHYTYNLIQALKKISDVSLVTTSEYEFQHSKSGIGVHCIFFKMAFTIINKVAWLSKETVFPTLLRRCLKVLEFPINAVQCAYIAKRERKQIIHFQTIHLIELFLVVLFKITGFKIVYTIHNVLPGHKKINFFQRIFYSLLYTCCDFLIIHSEISRLDAIKLYRISPKKIIVIPHGDYKFFIPKTPLSKPEAKEKLGISETSNTILFFGAIRSNKGLHDLLDAIPKIKNKISNIVLIIAGEPLQDYSKYQKHIQSLCISDTVVESLDYIPIEDVPIYFYASDIVILPYHEISQSGVLHLAYAFGKPVIASDIGGFREAVEDGKNGFLIPPQNPGLISEKVIKIIKNNLVDKMGKYSLYLADSKFSWESIAGKTYHLYKKLIDPRSL